MDRIKEIRMELAKNQRNASTKKVEKTLTNHFKKTSLKQVNRIV